MVISDANNRLRRKIAVVLAADVAEYAAHVAADEEGTIRRFAKLERHAAEIISAHAGRIFNTAGDAFLAEFDSAVHAVRAALDILEAVQSLALEAPPDRALVLRIGIAFGDVVITEDGNLLGDAINIAARLQALAVPGTICISQDVQSLVRNKVATTFVDLGKRQLKNIAQPVHAYAVRPGDAASSKIAPETGRDAAPPETARTRTAMPPRRVLTALGVFAVAGVVAALWLRPHHPAAVTVQGPMLAGCPVFPADNIWNTRVDHLPLHPKSATYVASIGASAPAHMDFGASAPGEKPIGIPFVVVPKDQKRVGVHFLAFGDEPHAEAESDPGPFPVPADAPIEGGSDSTDDRHVIVVQQGTCALTELYKARLRPDGGWNVVSAAQFDLNSHVLRRLRHTSADGAGLPILPGLVRFDEVAQGEIRHALRFTAPRTNRAFVWPARKFSSTRVDDSLPAMGQRFRLRADFDLSGYSQRNQVILTALKRYGMMLADNGGPWFVSGAPDQRWNNDDLRDLKRLKGTDFEAVDVSSLMVSEDSGQTRGR